MGSDPGLATPEKGGELVKLAVTGLIEEIRGLRRGAAGGAAEGRSQPSP